MQAISFVVALSAQSGKTVTVDYNTSNGSAISPGDFEASSGTITWTPGLLTQTIDVPIQGDLIVEGDETFFVNLVNPVNTIVGDGQSRRDDR